MTTLTFVATGDSIITRRVSHLKDTDFTDLVALIRSADAAFNNLELPLPKDPVVPNSSRALLCARPFVLDELAWMGLNLFDIANNHSIDYMYRGLVDTMEEFRQRGLAFAGAGENLDKARLPVYLETKGGRVGLVAAATPYSTTTWGGWATDPGPDCPGRPGINPLRYETRYVLDPARFAALKDIDEALGTAATTAHQRDFGVFFDGKAGAHTFLNGSFYQGESSAVVTEPNKNDLEEIARWIRGARRQSDLVVASLHAHEGPANERNRAEVADFIVKTAHAWIDAGADIFVGHGPHLLRPVEMYKGKPIFYSIGNFAFMTETLDRVPGEIYRLFGLPLNASPDDLFDIRSGAAAGKPRGFHANPAYWEAIVPVARYEDRRLASLELHPITMGQHMPRSQRGTPRLTSFDEGAAILERLAAMSQPYGAEITVGRQGERAVGMVRLD